MPISIHPEIALHAGFSFPQDNEDTFINDATNNFSAANELERLAEAIGQGGQVTSDTLHGMTGDAVSQNLGASQQDLLAQADQRRANGNALLQGGQNIAATKMNINQTMDDYMANATATEASMLASGATPAEIEAAKASLLAEAQGSVAQQNGALSTANTSVINAAQSGQQIPMSGIIQAIPAIAGQVGQLLTSFAQAAGAPGVGGMNTGMGSMGASPYSMDPYGTGMGGYGGGSLGMLGSTTQQTPASMIGSVLGNLFTSLFGGGSGMGTGMGSNPYGMGTGMGMGGTGMGYDPYGTGMGGYGSMGMPGMMGGMGTPSYGSPTNFNTLPSSPVSSMSTPGSGSSANPSNVQNLIDQVKAGGTVTASYDPEHGIQTHLDLNDPKADAGETATAGGDSGDSGRDSGDSGDSGESGKGDAGEGDAKDDAPTDTQDTPKDDAPAADAPADAPDDAPKDDAPTDDAPSAPVETGEPGDVDAAPAEDAPVADAPAQEAPAEEAPVEEGTNENPSGAYFDLTASADINTDLSYAHAPAASPDFVPVAPGMAPGATSGMNMAGAGPVVAGQASGPVAAPMTPAAPVSPMASAATPAAPVAPAAPATPAAPASPVSPSAAAPTPAPATSGPAVHPAPVAGGSPQPVGSSTAAPAAPAPAPVAPQVPLGAPAVASFLSSGPKSEVALSRTAATIMSEDIPALWGRSCAVAVFVRRNEIIQVYSSEDFLSFIPVHLELPKGVRLLENLPGVDAEFFRTWAGEDPVEKIEAWAADNDILGELVQVVRFDGNSGPMNSEDAEEIIKAQKFEMEVVHRGDGTEQEGDLRGRILSELDKIDDFGDSLSSTRIMLGKLHPGDGQYYRRLREYLRSELLQAKNDNNARDMLYIVRKIMELDTLDPQ